MKFSQLMSAADAGSNQTSTELELGDLTAAAIQVDFTGTPNGTVSLESSVNNVGYAAITGSSTTITAGSPSPVVYDIPESGYRFVRVKWVNTSGSGTITATTCVKEPANRF